ncbi:MAG: DUF4433 domain-containing protein [Clostridium sp.]|nr:DUF4433 domain-containing protein [Clostridium sp.]
MEWLYHFTRVENLKSILEYGLIPRNEIDEEEAIVNDDCRYDNWSYVNIMDTKS